MYYFFDLAKKTLKGIAFYLDVMIRGYLFCKIHLRLGPRLYQTCTFVQDFCMVYHAGVGIFKPRPPMEHSHYFANSPNVGGYREYFYIILIIDDS